MRRLIGGLARGLALAAAALAGVALAAAAALALALAAGPVELGPLAPAALAALNARLVPGGRRVAFERPALRWSPEARALALRVERLAVTAPDGAASLFAAPRAEAALDLASSWAAGRPVVPRVAFEGLEVRGIRTPDGRWALEPAWLDPGDGDGAPDRAALAAALRRALDGSAPLAGIDLGVVELRDLRLRLEDRASGAALEVERGTVRLDRGAPGGGRLAAALAFGGGGRASLDLGPTGPGGAVPAAARLESVELGPALEAFLPGGAGRGAALPVSGEARGELAPDGDPGDVALDLRLAAPALALPGLLAGPPVPVAELAARGTASPAAGTLRLDPLRLRAGGAEAVGSLDLARAPGDGAVAGAAGGPWSVRLDATGGGVDPATLAAFWPAALAPSVRAWLTERLTAGTAEDATARVSWEPARTPRLEVDLAFAGRGVALRFLDSMPPAVRVDGRARLTRDRFEATADAGALGPLEAAGAAVRIDVAAAGATDRLTLEATLEGGVAGALRVLASAPGGPARDLPFDADRVTGEGRYRFELALPLVADPPPGAVRVGLEATLRGLGIPDLVAGMPLAGAELDLAVADGALAASGTGRLGHLPFRLVSLRRDLRPGAPPGRVEVEARVDRVELSALGAPVGFLAGGTVGVRAGATLPPRRGPPASVEAELDLAAAEIAVPALRLFKPAGRPGTASFAARPGDGGGAEVTRFSVDIPGLGGARGSATLDMPAAAALARRRGAASVAPAPDTVGGWRRVELEEVLLGETRLGATLARAANGTVAATVRAPVLDLRPWLRGPAAPGAAGPAAGPPAPPLRLEATAARVLLPGGELRGLEATAERAGGAAGWRRIAAEARLPSGRPAGLTLGPPTGPGAAQPFELRAADAGGLVQLLDPGFRSGTGGSLRLAGSVAGWSPLRLRARLAAEGFAVERAPVLARILSLASLRGIQNALQGRGIAFDGADAEVTVDGPLVRIEGGRASGSELGLTAAGTASLAARTLDVEGTVVPFYTLNRILAGIPIVGDLLAGEGGVGAFAATYRIGGTFAAPEVSVNPLAAVVPGAIREIFSHLPPAEARDPEPGGRD